jgi:uncharacterized membrane protein YozB (DUF420 family)
VLNFNLSEITNNAVIILIIALSAFSGVLTRNFWLFRKRKAKKIDMGVNLSASFSTIFFTGLTKFFFFNKESWGYEAYAGISFTLGLASSLILDILTNPKLVIALLTKNAVREEIEEIQKEKEVETLVKEIKKEE